MDAHLPNLKNTDDLFADTENTWDYEDDDEGEFSGEKFNYHFVIGNEKIVFIKAGAGGSERGYEDKYIKLAERINEGTGATVITASNPIEKQMQNSLSQEARRIALLLKYSQI